MGREHELLVCALLQREGWIASARVREWEGGALGDAHGNGLAQELVRRGELSVDQKQLLDAQLADLLRSHGGDPLRALATVRTGASDAADGLETTLAMGSSLATGAPQAHSTLADGTGAAGHDGGGHGSDASSVETMVSMQAGGNGKGNGARPATLPTGASDASRVETLAHTQADGPGRVGDDLEKTQAMGATIDLSQQPGRKRDPDATLGGGADTIEGDPGHVLIASLGEPAESSTTRYTLSHVHASGGVGQVWLARDQSLGREVALKEIRGDREFAPVVLSRFVEEAQITGQLEHPGIVPVYELATRPGDKQPFYTMRFVRGKTLGQAIHQYHIDKREGKAGPLELRRLLDAFVDICNTVAYAHSRGVIHRDLKSANVVMGDFGEVVVLDWGLAKLVDQPQRLSEVGEVMAPEEAVAEAVRFSWADDPNAVREDTLQGQVLGTPAYMAPEQARGDIDQIDQRTDVYGLGAILYEILTERPPFERGVLQEVLRRVREEPPQAPREMDAQIEKPLEAICLKCLEKAPAQRYQSVEALGDEIRRWLADEPVSAWREPWAVRAGRWVRRHRTAAAGVAATLLVATTGLGIGYVLVSRERDEAATQRQVARQAVNDMYTGVAEEWLEDYLDPKQEQFLERALAYYENSAGRDAGKPDVQQERALAFLRVADIKRKVGRLEESEAAYRQAGTILQGLTSRFPEEAGFRFDLARLVNRLGALLAATGRGEEAGPLFDEASRTLESLAAAEPRDATYPLELGRVLANQGTLLRVERDSTAALDAFEGAVLQLEPLAGPTGTDVQPRRELGVTLDKQGTLLYEVGSYAEAQQALEHAVSVLEPLLAEFPTNPRIREGLANAQDTLTRSLIRQGQIREAEEQGRLAVAKYRRLAEDFPSRPEYRRLLARGLVNLGTQHVGEYRFDEAKLFLEEAQTCLVPLRDEIPAEPKILRDLCITRENLGQIAEATGRPEAALEHYAQAVEAGLQLVRKFPGVPDYQEYLATSTLSEAFILSQIEGIDAAQASLRDALATLSSLAATFPDVVLYRDSLANAYRSAGMILAQGKSPVEHEQSEVHYRKAVELRRAILQGLQGEQSSGEVNLATVLGDLAVDLNNLAELKKDGKRLDDAGTLYDEVIGIERQLLAADPESTVHQLDLATFLINQGDYLRELDRQDEALAALTEAEGIMGPLLSLADQLGPELNLRRGFLQTALGDVLLAQNEPAEAEEHLSEALAAYEAYAKSRGESVETTKGIRQTLMLTARAVMDQGSYDEAALTALELPKRAPDSLDARHDAARLLARCVTVVSLDERLPEDQRSRQVRSLGDRAIAQLRVAVDAGYQPAPGLSQDPELESLRERDDFRELAAAAAVESSP